MNTNTDTSTGNYTVPLWALRGLAIVGFITLIVAGIWLAVYAARFVPASVDGFNAAAVSLSQIFTPTKQPNTLAIVPNATSTAFSHVPKTSPATSTSAGSAKSTQHKITKPTNTKYKKYARHYVAPKVGKRTTHTYSIGNGMPKVPKLYGLPDLATHIIAVGYLTSTSTNSFIATTTIPAGTHTAIKFTITNIGTNKTGAWTFTAHIPTNVSYIFNSPIQKPLYPQDYIKQDHIIKIEYVLGFTQATPGSDQTISITANPKHTVAESNFKNNSATTSVTILGR